jgi:acetolactate synthase-1/2/3 large subunit
VSRRHDTAWHAVVDGLLSTGHDTVFGLPDDDLALLHAAAPTRLRVVLTRDQRNAVFMATGYARAGGRAGICVVGKGPALANAVAGLVEPWAARIPLLLLATGTASDRQGTGAFQELDQLRLVRPLVKLADRVEDPDLVCAALDRALTVASTGRPAPVYVELPEQLATTPVTQDLPWTVPTRQYPQSDPLASYAALTAVLAAERPLILAGGGMAGRDGGVVLDLADLLGAGVFVTASGRGSLDEHHPLFCGLSGLYASPEHQRLWADCDLVVALGTRLEETAVHGWDARDRLPPVVQVNVSEDDFSHRFPGHRLLGDAATTARRWVSEARVSTEPRTDASRRARWTERVRAATARAHAQADERRRRSACDPEVRVIDVLTAIQDLVPADTVLAQENGLQDMWSYHYPHWVCGAEGGCLAPSEQTSLGFGAAAAVGVRFTLPERPVVALVGDGAFDMFRSDLSTVVRERIPVLWVVLDNGGYGWLEYQRRRGDLAGSRFRFTGTPSNGCHEAVTGLYHRTVRSKADLGAALREAWRTCELGRPAVLRVGVALDDTPPGLEQLDGDFPGSATP